jgi:hypothetical protein
VVGGESRQVLGPRGSSEIIRWLSLSKAGHVASPADEGTPSAAKPAQY